MKNSEIQNLEKEKDKKNERILFFDNIINKNTQKSNTLQNKIQTQRKFKQKLEQKIEDGKSLYPERKQKIEN